MHHLLDALPMPDSEPFTGETLIADGWVYRDLPRMTPSAMTMFKGIVGEKEMRWLTWADYGDSVRGQLLISPQGIENMKAYAASVTKPHGQSECALNAPAGTP